MNRLWLSLLGLAVLLGAAQRSPGADPPAAKDAKDVRALADKIDQEIAAKWQAAHVQPAPEADDAEYLRRVYLDVAGRIPSVSEARAFLKDTRPDKRERLVNELLGGSRYVTHYTDVWRNLLLPESNNSIQVRFGAGGFESWIKKQIAENVGYDKMVQELLTAPVDGAGRPGLAVAYGDPNGIGPQAFYLAKEYKPENIAGATSRLFLGVRLECAQCHDHPFATWKRDQFWGYAAFFAGISRQQQGDFISPGRELTDKRELTIPNTERVVQATFLDGTEPKWKYKVSPRVTLAEWVTSADNPYFAKAAANRMWAHLFGTGLVDPVDELAGTESTCSHPALLNALAKEFAAHDFDWKFLIRAIMASKAYQLSSRGTHSSQDDHRVFARMAVKGLTAEQLYDSVAMATSYQENGPAGMSGIVVIGGPGGNRQDFLTKFGNTSDKLTESQTSILQALALMNGQLIASATTVERSELLAGVLDAPFLDTAGKVETLYLATLSRKPTDKERARCVGFIEKRGSEGSKGYNEAVADVFWALLNSGEFILNH
jgi:hypothetical protein